MTEYSIRLLELADAPIIEGAFSVFGLNKPAQKYVDYYTEQQAGTRVVLVATVDDVFAGYVTICWRSHYRPFREANFPEIVDFNVLPHFRQQGIGTRLLDEAESRIFADHPVVGIGVGMTADYGAAQHMYARRGYLPDGRGLMYEGYPVSYGKNIPVDDDLCLYFTKNRE